MRMRLTGTFLTAALLFCACPITARASLAQSILTTWPGSWSCVATTSTTSPVNLTMQATTYGTWVQFLGNEPAHDGNPARTFVMLVTYNHGAKKWFIDSYSNRGGMILSNSTAGPDQRRQTWNNIYPVNPAQEPGTIVMGDMTWDTYDAWTAHGKRITAHTSCKKSP
jgi:hypothetical protein